MNHSNDILSATEPVAKAFEKLGILYFIGGSLASSAYGIPRATMDIDMISDLKSNQVKSFVEILNSKYAIDENMIMDAIKRRSSFNIIHMDTMLKIDVFISKNGPYELETFKRRRQDTLSEENESIQFYIVSPEDIILNKLMWFELGGGVSDRQWYDVLGVLKVQKQLLDISYLEQWASKLNIKHLLIKSFHDSGLYE